MLTIGYKRLIVENMIKKFKDEFKMNLMFKETGKITRWDYYSKSKYSSLRCLFASSNFSYPKPIVKFIVLFYIVDKNAL